VTGNHILEFEQLREEVVRDFGRLNPDLAKATSSGALREGLRLCVPLLAEIPSVESTQLLAYRKQTIELERLHS
jgi:hypothetical protein